MSRSEGRRLNVSAFDMRLPEEAIYGLLFSNASQNYNDFAQRNPSIFLTSTSWRKFPRRP